jgi:DNA-binding CsgD family transcriptional regulator
MGREPETTVDFGKLNAAERTALTLLARGHTAKSIATLTDRSVGAVNERLREARRKTGVGSSRELARMFAAQENRDELIGVADAPPATALTDPQAARRGSLRRGPMMAIATIGGTAMIALLAMIAPQAKNGEAVSVIGTTFGSAASDPRVLNDRFLSEARDESWAPAAEAALDTRIAPIPHVGPIKVKCAATLCQVAGWIGPADTGEIDAAMRVLQGDELREDVLKLGLDDGSMWFGSDKVDRQRASFVIFWHRKAR